MLKKIIICLLAFCFVFIFCSAASSASKSQVTCIRKTNKAVVCLTVDDGYNKTVIKRMLKVFKEHEVKCTFFVIGCCLTAAPDLWRRAVKDGHEICYHSMYHKRVSGMSKAKIIADIKKWEKTAHKVLGKDYEIPKFARLPYGSGNKSLRVLKIFAGQGYRVIGWNVDTFRQKNIPRYIKNKTKPGSIILTHFCKRDAKALPDYIGWLKKKFNLCKISEAIKPIK